jgi:3-deoxy-D-manno-octulosonate 8-phosphate phosphatase (KDO 8-P phosphatase)
MEETLASRSSKIPPTLKKRASQIQVVLMDVDGTITDGSVTLLSQPDGSALEIKSFDAHDGQGMTLGRTAGLRLGVIRSAPQSRRHSEQRRFSRRRFA